MAILIANTVLGTAAFPDNNVGKQRTLVIASGDIASTSSGMLGRDATKNPYGTIGQPNTAPHVTGAVAINSYPRRFTHTALVSQKMIDEVAELIENGFLKVVDEAAPTVPLTRTTLQAFFP